MERFIINGGKKLSGSIEIKGAKNAALKVLAASLLTDRPVSIINVPEIEDVYKMLGLLENLGVKISHPKHGEYRIIAEEINNSTIDPEIAKKLRASIVLTAPILIRKKKVIFPHPGGCVIGERPIDLFIDGFRAFGGTVSNYNGLYQVTLPAKIKGIKFIFPNISVTATETLLMLAIFAEGETILKNCACEPEVQSLADFLNNLGADITGAGTPVVTVRGVKKLTRGNYKTIPDRIEAGSFAILAAATNSRIKIKNCEPDHLDSLLSLLKKSGVKLETGQNFIQIAPSKNLISIPVKTREYPGFPTDLQAPFSVLLTQTYGQSLVHETIFEGRFSWADELKRMGANILSLDPHRMIINGPTKLRGREIESPDLRAGMAYIIAALCARGQSIINNVYQIDRGYEQIEERLKKIGADIRRVN